MNNLLTVEEVKKYLDLEDTQLSQYVKQGRLHAYRIGGEYLRFRKEDVLNLRFELQPKKIRKSSLLARASDFWRFNNFYIIAILFVLALIFVAIRF